jgi:tRNA(Arg) A34 adenosine deaminase TadA
VNMLLNYFTANPSARQFPSKTIVFSTLTPCKQCSKYLESSRPAESVIFMGQKDTGSLGQVGEKYGVYLSAVTDSILNRVAQPIMKSRVVGSTTVKGWGGKTSTVPVTEQYQEGEKVSHYEVDSSLSEKMGQGATVAEQIGQKCNQILIQSMSTLTHKFDKERPTSQERLDQGVKIPVLNYLKLWIESVNSTSRQI